MSIFSDASLSNQSTVQQNKKKLRGSFYTSTRSDRSWTPAKRMLSDGQTLLSAYLLRLLAATTRFGILY